MTRSTDYPAATPSSLGRALQALRRLGWGVADQGVSSLSNFALGLFVARSYGATEFGAFSLAFLTYTFILNAARGVATDPLLVRFSGSAGTRWRLATSSAVGTALAVGAGAGAGCIALGFFLPDPMGRLFIVLGLGLPGLVVQDSWRFAFFSSGRGSSAFLNDLFWTVLLGFALVVLQRQGEGSAAGCLMAFGATATLAAVLGGLQARTFPRPGRARAWLQTHSALSGRYLVENISVSGAAQIRAWVLGAVAGLSVVGHVRASEILMGPVLIVFMGIGQVAVPEAARVFHRDPGRLSHFCHVLGAALASAALLWGLLLLTVFPLGPGPAVLGELWEPTTQLIPPITLAVALSSFIAATNAGLRAMGVARRSLRAQLANSGMYLVGGSLGAILGGALGTSWGVVAAHSLGALVYRHQLRAALREHAPSLVTDDRE